MASSASAASGLCGVLFLI